MNMSQENNDFEQMPQWLDHEDIKKEITYRICSNVYLLQLAWDIVVKVNRPLIVKWLAVVPSWAMAPILQNLIMNKILTKKIHDKNIRIRNIEEFKRLIVIHNLKYISNNGVLTLKYYKERELEALSEIDFRFEEQELIYASVAWYGSFSKSRLSSMMGLYNFNEGINIPLSYNNVRKLFFPIKSFSSQYNVNIFDRRLVPFSINYYSALATN